MNKNPELLRKAMANILKYPETHDQNAWIEKKFDVDGGMCGTTMCLAGHVAVVAGADLPPVLDPTWDGEWHLNEEGKFRTSGQYRDHLYQEGDEDILETHKWASKALGMGYEEKDYLFYFFGNAEELANRVDEVASAWEQGEEWDEYA